MPLTNQVIYGSHALNDTLQNILKQVNKWMAGETDGWWVVGKEASGVPAPVKA